MGVRLGVCAVAFFARQHNTPKAQKLKKEGGRGGEREINRERNHRIQYYKGQA